MKAVLLLALVALSAAAVVATDADVAVDVAADAASDAEVEAMIDAELNGESEAEAEAEADADAEDPQAAGQPRAGAATKPARVVANALMHPKRVITVPKGDARARDPTAEAVPPITMDTSVPAGQWLSPQPDLVPVLQAAAGTYCTPSATNVRSQPTTSGAVVLTTTAGEQVRVTATTERAANGYTWVPVSVRSKTGWMAKSLLASCSRPSTPSTPSTPATTSSTRYPLFKQCGQSWSNAYLGRCSPTQKTVCAIGCAVSSVAMVLKARGVNTDPGQLNTWLKANGGFSGCSIYWASVDKLGKTRCQGFQNASFATLCGWVRAGKGVVVNVNGGRHWVLVTGCDGAGNVLVNDPGYNRASYPFSAISRQVVYN